MTIVNDIINFLTSPSGSTLLGGLFLLSEALASIPAIKANSVFQLVMNFLSKFKPAASA